MMQPIVAIEDIYNGFGQPRRVPNTEGAIRDFKILMQNNPVAEDQRLWLIGEMEIETGEIKPIKPELLEKGVKDEHI